MSASPSYFAKQLAKNVSISGELDVKRIEEAPLLSGSAPTTLAYRAPGTSCPSVPTNCILRSLNIGAGLSRRISAALTDR